jgi:hypothetical protein
MNKRKSVSRVKADIKGVRGMLKADGSATDELLRERKRDNRREAAKYGRSRSNQ